MINPAARTSLIGASGLNGTVTAFYVAIPPELSNEIEQSLCEIWMLMYKSGFVKLMDGDFDIFR